MLAPEAGLTLAAFGLAVALGIGVSVLVDGIRTFRFGWRQPAAILGGVALLLPDPRLHRRRRSTAGGTRPEPAGSTRSRSPATLTARRASSACLWLGDPAVLPLDPVVLPDGTGYTLTRNSSGNVVGAAPRAGGRRRPRRRSTRSSSRATGSPTASDACSRPRVCAGSRCPATQGPDGGVAPPPLPGWRRALDGQLDLARLRSASGLVLYENLAWIPLRAVGEPGRRRRGAGRPARPDPRRRSAPTSAGPTPLASGATAPPGVVLWGEAYDSEWTASSSGTALRHVRTFGWANGYRVTSADPVSIEFGDQWQRWAMLGVSLLIWLFVVFRWWRTRVRVPRLSATQARESRERRARRDFFDDATDEETFWWERGMSAKKIHRVPILVALDRGRGRGDRVRQP